VCDYYQLTGQPANTEVLLNLDRPRFIKLILDSLKHFN
ncbi:MAG: pyrimidine-specific ribonucleoside hydrolase RihA, partial [Limosilactobacillus ingluviei]|nr:pyrimidine-specific ribonucleoside hydrolase RihA [Limosilactobacillus ingluviei]